jgi:hypothetical protein
VSFAAQAGLVNTDAVVVALDGEGVGLALKVAMLGEDQAVGVPEVGAEGDVPGVRKLRIQMAGCFGSTI